MNLDSAERLEIAEGYCRFRPAGSMSLVDAVATITLAIAFCRQQKIAKLLIDASEFDRLTPPALTERFLMVEDWAEAAAGAVIVAMVAPPHLIHPEKFGVRAAAHLGLRGDVFTSEDAASAWLSAQRLD